MHPNQRNGFPCRCEDCERERRDKHAVRTERDTLASQLAEAEATMDAYRGTIGQRERDVAALTAQVERLTADLAEARRMLVAANDDYVEQRRCRLATEAQLHMAQVHHEAQIAQLEQEKAEALALAEKWVQAFNRSEQFQSGPTKRAEAAEALIAGILHEYRDDLTKAACDECEHCAPLVMCSFHSLLSVLAGHTALQPAAARAPEEPTTKS